MATQQSVVFAETIRAMKLAMRRHDNGRFAPLLSLSLPPSPSPSPLSPSQNRRQRTTPVQRTETVLLTPSSTPDSDSDESVHQPTNRGNKLKRNASNVREGRLDITGGRSYKRVRLGLLLG